MKWNWTLIRGSERSVWFLTATIPKSSQCQSYIFPVALRPQGHRLMWRAHSLSFASSTRSVKEMLNFCRKSFGSKRPQALSTAWLMHVGVSLRGCALSNILNLYFCVKSVFKLNFVHLLYFTLVFRWWIRILVVWIKATLIHAPLAFNVWPLINFLNSDKGFPTRKTRQVSGSQLIFTPGPPIGLIWSWHHC